MKSVVSGKSAEIHRLLHSRYPRDVSSRELAWNGFATLGYRGEPGERAESVQPRHILGLWHGQTATGERPNGRGGYTRYARYPGRVTFVPPAINTSAGISIISQESSLFQELARVSAVAAAGMVGVASIGNAFGRVFWAWASDSITRRATFAVMFLAQVVLFWTLPDINSPGALTILAFIVLMCYG